MTTSQQILDCPMSHNDAGASTVREYLLALLEQVWIEEEGFNGKRPFGNSGWQYEVYEALHSAELIEGSLDEYGYLTVDVSPTDALVAKAIRSLR